jgi:AcrR family transcriptional regulator
VYLKWEGALSAPERLTRAESRARTRAALLDAGGRVFVRDGFARASVEAIAAEAGYTRGAFYSNFSSKEELFAELLQERVYALYADMAQRLLRGEERWTAREAGERVADVQADEGGRWMFRLWLELLAHAERSEEMRELAARFWSGNRALMTELVKRTYAARGAEPPIAPDRIASAFIAMDVGLALQHHVDPDAVPLDVYPDVWEVLFGPLARG